MPSLLDVRYALRLLWKSPQFTLLTVAVLGGGLGISIYTYSVLNTMLYKDLPLADAPRIVRILGQREGRNVPLDAFEVAALRSGARSLADVGAYTSGRSVFDDLDASRSIKTTQAEWSVFAFTRTQPLRGRAFLPEDGADGAEPVAVIGYDVWQSVFQGDPQAVGALARVDTRPTRIIGVMPPGYAFPISAEMWVPLKRAELDPPSYSGLTLNAYARLQPGAGAAAAEAELNAHLRALHRQVPRPGAEGESPDSLGVAVSSFQLAQTGAEGPFVFAVLNVVALFILLLACVNVGNLLLARTNERVKEIAVRLALGAPRARLVTQMVLESVLICAIGGGPAVALAGWALGATNGFLRTSFEGDLPYWWHWSLDFDTLAMAGGFLLFTILVVAVLPAYGATRVNISTFLRDGSRGVPGRAAGRVARALVIVQIVLISVVIQVGSVMGMIAYRAAHVDLGMDTTRLVTMPLGLAGANYDEPAEQRAFYERLLSELRQSPELQGAVLMQEAGETRFAVDGASYGRAEDYPEASLVLSSDAPTQVGTRLVAGRAFDGRDSESGQKTALVSEALAQAFWPGESPLGRHLRLVRDDAPSEESRVVVGVLSNVKRGEVLSNRRETLFSVYVPLAQSPLAAVSVLARYRGSEHDARAALYAAVQRIDADLARGRIMNYDAVLKQLTLVASTLTDLFMACGAFAILLAMTGIYGLTSNSVIRRTHEIGLRRAIGASERNIVALFLGQACRQLLAGLVASAGISAGLLYVIARVAGLGGGLLLFSGLLVTTAIAALVIAAVFIPIRRAVEVEPSVALRCE